MALVSESDPTAVVTRFYEDFNRGDVNAAVAGFSEQLEVSDPGMGTVHGIEPFREYLVTFKRAMPDAQAVIDHVHEAVDTVIIEGRFVGTHSGPLATPDGDVEPTGASVELHFVDVSRVLDGRVVSYHTYYDQLALLSQLGLIEEE
jgi:ketosteroid isomerase-like protein